MVRFDPGIRMQVVLIEGAAPRAVQARVRRFPRRRACVSRSRCALAHAATAASRSAASALASTPARRSMSARERRSVMATSKPP